MKIIVINPILFTHEKGIIPHVTTIKETMIYDLCLAYHRAGHAVTLIAAADYAPERKETYDFEVVFLKSIGRKIFQPSVLPFLPGVWKYLQQRKGDVDMVLASETFSIPSLFASLIVPCKTVIWQELGSHNRKMKTLPSRIWYNVIARCFMSRSYVIPRSYVSQRFINRYMPRVGEPIGHGVKSIDLDNTTKGKSDQFITVGQLIPRKNISSIIRKFDAFLSKYPQYRDYILYIAGDGVLREEYDRQIKEMGRERQIVLLGKLPHKELFRYYRDSKASLFDSLRELNMLAIMESVAMTTPVVTNRVPFDSEIVEKRKLGIAKNDWNEDDIARMIERNDEYVENCREYASLITVDAVARRIIDSFEKASKYNVRYSKGNRDCIGRYRALYSR